MKELLLHVDAFADVDLSAYDEAVFEGAYLHEIFTMAEEEVTELDFGDGYDIDCEPFSFDEEDQTLTVCVNMKASVTLPDDFSGTPDEAFERMQKEITELDFGEAYNIDSRPARILEQANAMENSIPSAPSYEYNALFSLSCSVPKPVFEALPGKDIWEKANRFLHANWNGRGSVDAFQVLPSGNDGSYIITGDYDADFALTSPLPEDYEPVECDEYEKLKDFGFPESTTQAIQKCFQELQAAYENVAQDVSVCFKDLSPKGVWDKAPVQEDPVTLSQRAKTDFLTSCTDFSRVMKELGVSQTEINKQMLSLMREATTEKSKGMIR